MQRLAGIVVQSAVLEPYCKITEGYHHVATVPVTACHCKVSHQKTVMKKQYNVLVGHMSLFIAFLPFCVHRIEACKFIGECLYNRLHLDATILHTFLKLFCFTESADSCQFHHDIAVHNRSEESITGPIIFDILLVVAPKIPPTPIKDRNPFIERYAVGLRGTEMRPK